MTRGRVHDEMSRLVDDDEGTVLKGDVEGDLLGRRRGRHRLGHVDDESIPRFDPAAAVFYGRAGGIFNVA